MKNSIFENDARCISEIWKEWQISDLLGKGGFGRVYKAVREKAGVEEEAAVKIISVKCDDEDYELFAPTEEITDGFSKESGREKYEKCLNEIKAMASLSTHPNVVSIRDHHEVDRKDFRDIYILMELLCPLDKYLKGRVLTRNEVIKIGSDICSALESCESKKLIHRDVKISNIFATENGCFKLGDFGVVGALENTLHKQQTRIGTGGYMAPEVFNGKEYDHRADIYSLGKVLEVLIEPESDEAKRLGFVPCRRGCGDLREVIKKATEEKPEDRFKSASQMRKALEALNTGKKKVKTRSAKLRKFKAIVITTLVILAALAVGAVALYYSSPFFKAYKSFENNDFETAAYIYNDSVKDNFIYRPLFLRKMDGAKDEVMESYLSGKVDYATTIRALETLVLMDMADMNDISEVKKAETNTSLIESAETKYQSKDYTGALEDYSKISSESPLISKALSGAQVAFDAYVDEISSGIYKNVKGGYFTDAFDRIDETYRYLLAGVDSSKLDKVKSDVMEKYCQHVSEEVDYYTEYGYFSQAFDYVDEAYEDLPEGFDSARLDEIKNSISEKHYRYVSAKVNDYVQSDSYSSALDEIRQAISCDNSQELLNLKSETEAKFESYVKTSVESFSEKGDFEKAKEMIDKALRIMPDSRTLKTLAEEINGNLSKVFMSQCKAYDYRNYSDYTGNYGFYMSGKEYTNGFTLYSYGDTDKGYVDFNIDKNYKNLTFIFGHKDSTGMNDGVLRIYGDGVLIKEVEATASALPREISVNVENVSILKFELVTNSSAYYGLGKITAE